MLEMVLADKQRRKNHWNVHRKGPFLSAIQLPCGQPCVITDGTASFS